MCKPRIFKYSVSTHIRRRNHPYIFRIQGIGECLEKTGEVLAGSSRDAYLFRDYLLFRLVEIEELRSN